MDILQALAQANNDELELNNNALETEQKSKAVDSIHPEVFKTELKKMGVNAETINDCLTMYPPSHWDFLLNYFETKNND